MSVVSTSEIKLPETGAGVIRIGDTRVSLDSVMVAFNQGSAPEQIVYDYDSISLPEVYATISYYLQHRKEVDSYLPRVSNKTKSCENLMKHGPVKKGCAINYWFAAAMPHKSPKCFSYPTKILTTALYADCSVVFRILI